MSPVWTWAPPAPFIPRGGNGKFRIRESRERRSKKESTIKEFIPPGPRQVQSRFFSSLRSSPKPCPAEYSRGSSVSTRRGRKFCSFHGVPLLSCFSRRVIFDHYANSRNQSRTESVFTNNLMKRFWGRFLVVGTVIIQGE